MARGIEVRGVTCSYGDGRKQMTAIEDVTFNVRLGEIAMVIGPSGAGKSTLLNAVAGMHPLDAGSVVLAEVPSCKTVAGVPARPAGDVVGNED